MDVVNIIVGLGLLYGIHSMTTKNKKLRNTTITSIKPTNSKPTSKPNSTHTTISKPNRNKHNKKINQQTKQQPKPTISDQELTNIKCYFGMFFMNHLPKRIRKKRT